LSNEQFVKLDINYFIQPEAQGIGKIHGAPGVLVPMILWTLLRPSFPGNDCRAETTTNWLSQLARTTEDNVVDILNSFVKLKRGRFEWKYLNEESGLIEFYYPGFGGRHETLANRITMNKENTSPNRGRPKKDAAQPQPPVDYAAKTGDPKPVHGGQLMEAREDSVLIAAIRAKIGKVQTRGRLDKVLTRVIELESDEFCTRAEVVAAIAQAPDGESYDFFATGLPKYVAAARTANPPKRKSATQEFQERTFKRTPEGEYLTNAEGQLIRRESWDPENCFYTPEGEPIIITTED